MTAGHRGVKSIYAVIIIFISRYAMPYCHPTLTEGQCAYGFGVPYVSNVHNLIPGVDTPGCNIPPLQGWFDNL